MVHNFLCNRKKFMTLTVNPPDQNFLLADQTLRVDYYREMFSTKIKCV